MYQIWSSNTPHSQDIGQNSDGGIPDNSRTSDNIDMKLGQVTKRDKRNKSPSKKFADNIMTENYGVIVIFTIYGQFRALRKPDF